MFLKRLCVRIWLAVVLAVAVLTLLVGWAWRLTSAPPLRDVVIRNEAGQIIGYGQSRLLRSPGNGVLRLGPMSGGSIPSDKAASAPPADPATASPIGPFGSIGRYGSGPEFVVLMVNGEAVHLQLPQSQHTPFGFFWTLVLVGVAVALGTYPIIRTLTRRLERLRHSVEQWGAGDLSVRVPVSGKDEVAFLAERFNHAAERIETLVKSQKSLLANASHELRSPLTRIRMGLELMGTPASPTFKNEISRNIAELDQLIDEILLASRLDAHEADLGTVETVDLVGLAAEECARVNAGLEVQTGATSLLVQGVNKLLRRVVRNLLENANRHAAGRVSVTLQQTGEQAVIHVCDHGPGIPAALRERIFEPFYRLPGATERDGGVGLGLALVKSIVARHGGSVRCEDHLGGGACFVVELPLSSSTTNPAPGASAG